jgi:D-sedoheptulose 7-phosphate isomerase
MTETDIDIEALVAESLRDSAAAVASAATELPASVAVAARALTDALRRGRKVLACGNGGSAADAQHFAAELVGRFARERDPLPAIALTTDSSALTAIANDYGVEAIFERQVRALGAPGDVLLAISTSGNSANVRAAVAAARERGLTTIALTGATGGELAAACEHAIRAPANATARVQEAHVAVIHAICVAVDEVCGG